MIENPYLTTFVFSLSINLFFFLFAFLFKTDKLTDFTYGLSFIALTLYSFMSGDKNHLGSYLLLFMILAWAIRLIIYLFSRILKMKKDSRFDTMRESFWGFLKFWFFQGLTVWVILLPSLYFLTQSNTTPLHWVSYLGFAIWFMGLLVETLADKQKSDFKSNPRNKDGWIQTGLWKYSRHPNYFGEIMLWWGVYIFTIPSFVGWSWITVIGPLFITFILLFVSGIPILEKKYSEKYQSNALYQKYRRSTSLLIPLPPKG